MLDEDTRTADLTGLPSLLLERARKRFGTVLPCGSRRALEDCFTKLPSGELVFWYNTLDGNTHIEKAGGKRARN